MSARCRSPSAQESDRRTWFDERMNVGQMLANAARRHPERPAITWGDDRLDYAMFDPGDGPAVFVILIVGFLVSGSALIVEVKYQPPYWVHIALWLPAIVILSFALLRLIKATLLVLQYKHHAGEGRLE